MFSSTSSSSSLPLNAVKLLVSLKRMQKCGRQKQNNVPSDDDIVDAKLKNHLKYLIFLCNSSRAAVFLRFLEMYLRRRIRFPFELVCESVSLCQCVCVSVFFNIFHFYPQSTRIYLRIYALNDGFSVWCCGFVVWELNVGIGCLDRPKPNTNATTNL